MAIRAAAHPGSHLRLALAGAAALLFLAFNASAAPLESSVFASTLVTPAPDAPLQGIHLGNHISQEDWDSALLRRIDPKLGGTWPKVIVFLSYNVYDRVRDTNCRLQSVNIPSSRASVRDYLQRASVNNVQIIIRIMPSPGNLDAAHHLSLAASPVNGNRCDDGLDPSSRGNRSYDDVGEEIVKIHEWNASHNITEFGFEPANEPNAEWYTDEPNTVHRDTQTAWVEMDAYFSAIYDYVHTRYPSPTIRVLTPPMAQSAFAEARNVNGCGPMTLQNGGHGYEYMPNIFLNGTKNDGYTWHNYWRQDFESWASCEQAASPRGQHVAYWFPPQMLTSMVLKPRIISEADLASPQQGFGNPLTDKDIDTGIPAANSIQRFINAEAWADHIAVWTLNITNGFPGSEEQNWHEAYRCNDFPNPYQFTPREREWFTRWWTGSSGAFASCYKSYLPASIKSYPEELIQNGNFSLGTSYWTYSRSNCAHPLVATHPSEGQPAARLGHCNNNTDELYQTITIPASAVTARLTYRVYIESSNATGLADYLYIQVRNTAGQVLESLTTINDASAFPKATWLAYSHNLTAYKGQTIRVYFRAVLDALVATRFWVDDVSVQVTR